MSVEPNSNDNKVGPTISANAGGKRRSNPHGYFRGIGAVLLLVSMLTATLVGLAPDARADGDENCESGEVCVHDYHNGPVWSTPGDEMYYTLRYYDSTGGTVNNTANSITNLGNSCGVTIFSGTNRFGSTQYIAMGYIYDMSYASMGSNAASSHDFCFVA